MNKSEEIIDQEIGLISQCTINKGELANCAIINSEIWDGFMDGTTIRDTRWGDAVFNNVFLDSADLSHMSMRGARFKLVNMKDVSFSELSMEGSSFEGVTMAGCTLDRVDFKEAVIKNSDLKGIDIVCCGYQGMTIEGVEVEELIKAYNTLHPDEKVILNY
ncbi:MAG: pentapeptide repeat-containing protein [Oscillospiraceae bacterium]|nr:pentapeptide repeat-containing protein [Oscillospiraceae bacterium]